MCDAAGTETTGRMTSGVWSDAQKSVSWSQLKRLVINVLTGVWCGHLGLQLLDLLDQQGDVLQQVFVLQQQLVDAGLGLQSRCGLCAQLVL